ncbi:c-type cytochrome [Thiogranum longum]
MTTLLAACDPREASDVESFDQATAMAQWNNAAKTWSDSELRVLEKGRTLYKHNCAACHLVSGEGQSTLGAPPLAGSAVVTGPAASHIRLVLEGRASMPPFGTLLDDAEIAALVSYERNAWGNNTARIVTGLQVREQRAR